MNALKQTLIAAALSTVAAGAQATEFYIDLDDTDKGGGFADTTNCATCTADAEELNIKYKSHTAITLTGHGVSVGDAIHTTGGYSTDGYGFNAVTSLNPAAETYNFTDTAYSTANMWGLSFDFDMYGEVASLDGANVGDVTYDSGKIKVYFMTFKVPVGGVPVDVDGDGDIDEADLIDGADLAMTLNVTGSDLDNNSNLLIFGTLDFTDVDNTYRNLFNIQGGASCAGDITFDGLAACDPPLDFTFAIDQNLNNPEFESQSQDGKILTVKGDHDGSLRFYVPEPGTLFLMSGALLGMAGVSRRKRS